jgi:hypothetical protein
VGLLMYYLSILVVGIFAGLYGPVWLGRFLGYMENRQILKDIMPQEVSEEKLCRGSHSWINAQTLTHEGRGSIQVCQVCGFIPSIDKMATPEAIDSIEEHNRLSAIQGKIYTDFQAQEDGDIKKYFAEEIKNGVSFEKLAHVHAAGLTFGARYAIYRASRAEEIKKAVTGSNA